MLHTDSWSCSKSSGSVRYGAWANSEIFISSPWWRGGRWCSSAGGDVVDEVGAEDAATDDGVGVDDAGVVVERESDHGELAPVEQERFFAVGDLGLDDLAELQHVVSALIGLPGPAAECRQSAGQSGRQTLLALLPTDLESVAWAASELHGDVELGGLEHVDRERHLSQVVHSLGRPGQGNQDQRRVHRDRGEGVHGDPAGLVVYEIADDSDPGNEPGKTRAQVPGLQRRVAHRVLLSS